MCKYRNSVPIRKMLQSFMSQRLPSSCVVLVMPIRICFYGAPIVVTERCAGISSRWRCSSSRSDSSRSTSSASRCVRKPRANLARCPATTPVISDASKREKRYPANSFDWYLQISTNLAPMDVFHLGGSPANQPAAYWGHSPVGNIEVLRRPAFFVIIK